MQSIYVLALILIVLFIFVIGGVVSVQGTDSDKLYYWYTLLAIIGFTLLTFIMREADLPIGFGISGALMGMAILAMTGFLFMYSTTNSNARPFIAAVIVMMWFLLVYFRIKP